MLFKNKMVLTKVFIAKKSKFIHTEKCRKSYRSVFCNKIEKERITMNKSELVAAMAEKAGISKKDADKSLAAFIEIVEDAVKADEKVQLIGFGTFEARAREAREGKNPRTGEKITIAACKSPAFKAGKAFKDMLNK